MPTISEKFGLAIKETRGKIGMSQEKLAEMADIDRTYVSMIERGKRQLTLEVANRIAIALNSKLSEILKRVETDF
jgi:transcriptional regulator with XRE-family HTH domain